MSRPKSQVQRIDAKLTRLHVLSSGDSPEVTLHQDDAGTDQAEQAPNEDLQKHIRSFSSTHYLLDPQKLSSLLRDASVSSHGAAEEWVLVGKAAAQTHGLILNSLLDQILSLNRDIWYWDEVLNASAHRGVYYYYLQTSPLRFWAWSKDVYSIFRQKAQSLREDVQEQEQAQERAHTASWDRFWNIVQESVHERSLANVRSKIMSPLTQCRIEARKKQKSLQALRELSATGLGILMDEGMRFDIEEDDLTLHEASDDDWRSVITKSIHLMETVLDHGSAVLSSHHSVDFEEDVFAIVNSDIEGHVEAADPAALAERLTKIIKEYLPEHLDTLNLVVKVNGRPSHITRYWLPVTAFILASGASLSLMYRHRAEVVTWIHDFGATMRDFWYNWVYEPIKKTIGTIRHDKDSEIAIMSKESLEGDRASLERMVVDFSKDHPTNPGDQPFGDAELAALRAKVREGDLTPVLKAYERDLQRPIMGTIRGDLIRALLIQIQKTKVDVEVALGGIDALLKSQELVFAYVKLLRMSFRF